MSTDVGQVQAFSDDPYSEPAQSWANKSQVAYSPPDDGRFIHGAWPSTAPNGDVYVAFVDYGPASEANFSLRLRKSTDGGATWVAVADIATDLPVPREFLATEACPSDALKGWIRNPPFPQIAISADTQAPAGYVIHAVYQYDPGPVGGDVADVFYRRSLTGAGSAGSPAWEAERRLNDDQTSTDQWNPAIAATSAGYVAASWYDRRLDPTSNLFFDRHIATSQDAGETWAANLLVSDSSSPVSRNWPTHVDLDIAPCYHGDYDQVAITGSAVHVAWSDDRRVGPGCPYDPNGPNDPFQSSCPNPDVYYDEWSGFDFDLDGLTDVTDGCPTVASSGVDVDGDSVDDACDTCRRQPDFNNDVLGLGPNPVFTGNATSRTPVSGQIDDDADGIGNHCDFDYDNQGLTITVTDWNNMKASQGKSISLSTCGQDGTQRCTKYDHDGIGLTVGVTDFNKAKAAQGGAISANPWEKMSCGAACTPPLSPPLGGPGQPVLGKVTCEGVTCP